MNRIVLIGNGFDLAHGLPTRYEDFINDYWKGFMNYCISKDVCDIYGNYQYDDCIKLVFERQGDTLSQHLPNGDNPYNTPNKTPVSYNELKEFKDKYYKQYQNIQFNIDNKFLTHLLKISTENKSWVDIENEYYKFLIYQFDTTKYNGYYYGDINTLNSDYHHIKEKLNEYLANIIKETEIQPFEQIQEIIYSLMVLKDFTDIGKESLEEEENQKFIRYQQGIKTGRYPRLSKDPHPILSTYDNYSGKKLKEVILSDFKKEGVSTEYFDLKPAEILFLNFNYTDAEKYYSSNENFEIETIHIHGELNNPKNPIIFGYGDELEENYIKLENLNDNAYLENIKSINYQETDNYKRMLNFIDSNKYQIIILGHSCGNSDRTLLNTLFEHENCVSIKPYYYQYKDKKTGEIKDNYSDIVRNISRCFTDKKSMRDKVVNKTYTDWFSRDIE